MPSPAPAAAHPLALPPPTPPPIPTQPEFYIVKTDGAAPKNGQKNRSNRSSAGAVLFAPYLDEDGPKICLARFCYLMPSAASNNEAEYQAFLNGLTLILHWKLPKAKLLTDSKLILAQVNGHARCNFPHLQVLLAKARKLVEKIRRQGTILRLNHVLRHFNKEADAAANKALEDQRSSLFCLCATPAVTCAPAALQPFLPNGFHVKTPIQRWSMSRLALVPREAPSPRYQPTPLPPALSSDLAPMQSDAIIEPTAVTPTVKPLNNRPVTKVTAEKRPFSLIAHPSSTSGTHAPPQCQPPGPVLPVADLPEGLLPLPPSSICSDDMDISLSRYSDDLPPLSDDVDMSPDSAGHPSSPTAAASCFLDDMLGLFYADVDPVLPDPALCIPQPRLLLPRNLTEDQMESLDASTRLFAQEMLRSITDAADWPAFENTLHGFPTRLAAVINAFNTEKRPNLGPATAGVANIGQKKFSVAEVRRLNPRRLPRHANEARLQDALADMAHVQKTYPKDQRAVHRARRKVARINKAMRRSALRKQFNTNESRCVAEIFRRALSSDDAPDACPIPLADLTAHFESVNAPRRPFDPKHPSGSMFRDILDEMPPPASGEDLFTSEITAEEVEKVLFKVNKLSAPGLDGNTYQAYAQFKVALLPLLVAVFRRCWKEKKIPQAWKLSCTKLAFKAGDPHNASNWRPLAMQSTLYKLYTSILQRRLGSWAEENNRIHNAQKGFRDGVAGCDEHQFVSHAMLDDTRRSKLPIYMVYYDIKNAFGAIPHEYLWFVLKAMGVPTDFVALLDDIYTNAYTLVSTPAGMSPPIRQRVGVFQGCPLSPLLFILGMAPLVETLQAFVTEYGIKLADGVQLTTSAFADDLKVFSRSKAGIQRLHDIVTQFLCWTTLQANPAKCALLASVPDPCSAGRYKRLHDPLVLTLNDVPIPTLQYEDSYKYLGIREGPSSEVIQFQLTPKLAKLRKQVTALATSGLAPWQVVKAIKVYVLSQLDYPLRHIRCTSSELKGFTAHLYKTLRHLFRLPTNATSMFFAAPISSGGLGLLPLDEYRDALLLANAYKLLHSPDVQIQLVARAQLRSVIMHRFNISEQALSDGGDQLLQHFLNGTMATQDITPLKNSKDIPNWWNDLVNILSRSNLQFCTAGDDHFSLVTLSSMTPVNIKNVTACIKLQYKMLATNKWAIMKDQGRTVNLHGDMGSKFLASGMDMWDPDYRFAVAARLNQVDTRSVLKRRRIRPTGDCRHCGSVQPETLAHVLQRCPYNEAQIRKRHDQVLALIVSAISKANPEATLLVNQTVPNFVGPILKPDIQLYTLRNNREEAVILDLAIAYEDSELKDGLNVFQRTAEGKNIKYQPLSRYLVNLGKAVFNIALVYGSLGSVAAKNLELLTLVLDVPKAVVHKLQAKISAMNIKASRRIWAHHCAASHSKPPGGGFNTAVSANQHRTSDHRCTPGHSTG
jgi:ribonuclease HI